MVQKGEIVKLAETIKTVLESSLPAGFPEVQNIVIGRRDSSPEDFLLMIEVMEAKLAKQTMARNEMTFAVKLILRTSVPDPEQSFRVTADLSEAIFSTIYNNPTLNNTVSGISPFAGGMNLIELGVTNESTLMTRESEITFLVNKTT
ncbi:MAG: hypothetical protein IBX39_09095 [Candidatus Methanoperedenaceae archaeon]|nr:hypothetical protein [Candidatus Methanoperedenaceae archaeon]